MTTIECKSCGANVEIPEGSVSGICSYCGSSAVLPQAAFGDRAMVPMLVYGDDDVELLATDRTIMMLLDKLAAGGTEYVFLSEKDGNRAYLQSAGDEDNGYILAYHTTREDIGRLCITESIEEIKDAFRKFRRCDFSFVNDHTWEVPPPLEQ